MDVTALPDLIKSLGPSAIVAIILWIMLQKSEKREEKKDLRIQMLENLLTESYGERIEAADQIAEAMHSNANAIHMLTTEVRSIK